MRSQFLVIAVSALAIATPAQAQSRASGGLRDTIGSKLELLVAAANAGDAEAFFALSSGSSETVFVGDGQLMQGRDEVRANLGRLFVEHDRYRFVLSDVDVTSAGRGVAIALAPYQFTAVGNAAAVRMQGAFTVVFERKWFWQEWKVVHSHRSTERGWRVSSSLRSDLALDALE
jgi:hypothetical protein